jgi:alpha-glucosidase
VPESLKIPAFYKKYLDCGGLPVVSSERVPDAALFESARLVDKMLVGRPDIRKALIERGGRMMVVGAKEGITDLPEYAWLKPREFWNKRSRGFGGGHNKVPTSVAEENLLCLPVDIFEEENILIHEFAHTIHEVLRRVEADKPFDEVLQATHAKALEKGLWSCPYKDMYAAVNHTEYWAEGVQCYFDANNQNNFKHNHVNTREELKAYDPDLARLVEKTFNLTKETDWRYKPLVKRPQVAAPDASLKCDPFYRKEVWARGLPILGSGNVSDEALLEANHVVRHMFAYRHDILMAMIDDGMRLVVVGTKEKLADIPEFKSSGATEDKATRVFSYGPDLKIIAVSEENLLNGEGDPHAGESVLVRELARALHTVTGLRPVDEELEKALEQYKTVTREKRSSVRILRSKIGVKPIDNRFDTNLKGLHRKASGKGLWKGTVAGESHENYWAEGVQSWFDANREGGDGHGEVNTRKELEEYDPDLAALIAQVFCHAMRVDWRYQQPAAGKAGEE